MRTELAAHIIALPSADMPYTFGRPLESYVSPVQHLALLNLRSRIDDACYHLGHREKQGRIIEHRYASIRSTGASAAGRRITVNLEDC